MKRSGITIIFLVVFLVGCCNNSSNNTQVISKLNEQLQQKQEELNKQKEALITFQEEVSKYNDIEKGKIDINNTINFRKEFNTELPPEMEVYRNTKSSFSNHEERIGIALSKAMVIVNHLQYFTYNKNDINEPVDSFSQKLLSKKIGLNETISGNYNYFLQLIFNNPVDLLMKTHNGDEHFKTAEVWFILQDNGIPTFYIKDENQKFMRYDCEPGFKYDWKLWVKTLFDYDINLYRSTGEVPHR
ncbi:hypothetical protein [Paenibacillus sp. V4I7]|uniref:hypothetical protein n=1 Tax=Paenibacillus sp. V4I7 TaxID=3042307 RepID=UPI0027829DD3|nr:hypothetical protein [Paenibacillus sp. V4I7]MDQ0899905.1 putative membrane protein [Paenibacillus sp. V4I7]